MAATGRTREERALRREMLFARYDEMGANALEDNELLEILLAHTTASDDTEAVAERLMDSFGSLPTLLGASPQAMVNGVGVDESTAILIAEVAPLAARMKLPPSSGVYLKTSQAAGEYAISLFTHDKMESFYVLFLDARKRLVATELLGRGTVDEVPIYPRRIADLSIKYRSESIVLAHNHPSGLLSASSRDYVSTVAVRNALKEVGIRIMDHIIVGDRRYYSFAEKTLLNGSGE